MGLLYRNPVVLGTTESRHNAYFGGGFPKLRVVLATLITVHQIEKLSMQTMHSFHFLI